MGFVAMTKKRIYGRLPRTEIFGLKDIWRTTRQHFSAKDNIRMEFYPSDLQLIEVLRDLQATSYGASLKGDDGADNINGSACS